MSVQANPTVPLASTSNTAIAPVRVAPFATRWKRWVSASLGERRAKALHQIQWATTEELTDRRFTWAEKTSAWRRGFTAESAAMYGFPRADWGDYVSDYIRENIAWLINGAPQLFDQKLVLKHLLITHGFPQPEAFALVARAGTGAQLDPLGKGTRLVSLSQLEEAMRADGGHFIVKPQDLGGGMGVALVTAREGKLMRRRRGAWAPYAFKPVPRTLLVERQLSQHEFWHGLYPEAANTMRLLTMWTPGEPEPFIAVAAQRIGTVRSAPTDNFAQDGLAVPIRLDTGTLGPAQLIPTSGRPPRYTQHPESGVQIDGVRLPFWDRICETALAAARVVGFARYVGWDLLVDPHGTPIIIEGNTNAGVQILQMDGGLLKNPRVRRFYQSLGVM
jgi:hypothetical protein